MKWNELKNKGWNIKHFKSISEFLKATDKPLRSDFGNRESSKTGSKSFTGTSNYNEDMKKYNAQMRDKPQKAKAVDYIESMGFDCSLYNEDGEQQFFKSGERKGVRKEDCCTLLDAGRLRK